MKKFYTLEIELWNESRDAREEAQRILNQEPIDKTNLLLATHRKGVIAFMESLSYPFIAMAYKTFCKYLKKQKKVLLVPVITLVVEANKDTEPENFVKLQKELEADTNLFHRFMFYVNDEGIEKEADLCKNESQ
ncbi:hypothetical protein [Raineya sp.]|jgi:hypothetical protein